ncbi:Uncharacterised protein [Candidatus Tiddalikarchaeum anstoanum]|nr:Uncharacterised protein [Candidatus Tiddalikarchaeum anstoanum]
MKFNKWIKENKNLLIVLGVIGLVLVGIFGYNWYTMYRIEQMLDITNVSTNIGTNVIKTLREFGEANVIISVNLSSSDELNSLVISTLSEEEFRPRHISLYGTWFSGYLSVIGFEKLKNNPYILSIEINEAVSGS